MNTLAVVTVAGLAAASCWTFAARAGEAPGQPHAAADAVHAEPKRHAHAGHAHRAAPHAARPLRAGDGQRRHEIAPKRKSPPAHGKDNEHGHKHEAPAHGHDALRGSLPGEAHHEHGVETENLFGFTLGSDTEEAGAKGLALENVIRIGKRGTYRGLGQKLEFSFGATDDLSLSFSLLGDHHHVRNVPGFEDVRGRYAFNGFGGELRWRLLDRKTSPFGLTLHLEPSIARIDEVTGQAGRRIGSENKLIFDRELIPDTLFGAVNLLYDIERMKERHASFVAERAATAGIGAALAYRVSDDVFLGAEARYLRAYQGFALEKWQGHAVYVGPTLFARIVRNGWVSAAWNAQVAGREAIDRAGRAETFLAFSEASEAALASGDPAPPAPTFGRRGGKDLVNFERHQFRLKVGLEF